MRKPKKEWVYVMVPDHDLRPKTMEVEVTHIVPEPKTIRVQVVTTTREVPTPRRRKPRR